MTLHIPEELDEVLTPEWLTAALHPRFGVTVTSVTRGPVVARVCTNARFRIECDEPMPPDLPAELCAKGFFGDFMKGHRQAGEPEARFYDEVAPMLEMRTLKSVFASVDPETRHGVVISEDVVAQGATFLDARDDYTPDLAAESLDELAKLHLATWESPQLADVAWLAPHLGRQLEARGVNEIRHNFEGPIGAGVPDGVRDAERLVEVYRELVAETASPSPWCIVHGDAHINNVFLDADGHPGIVDWQLAQRGSWYLDVGYHLGCVLSVEVRRAVEHDLVQHYLDRIAAGGIQVPHDDEVRSGIRRGILHGLFLWGITMMVDPAITTIMLERLGTAAADHDALAIA
ncbi:MAG: aminoglycoside phosphotransferase [Actinobacteria bacterium]|nr:aminoglycoside phosphotransferase [Actinomycetota bacterium]